MTKGWDYVSHSKSIVKTTFIKICHKFSDRFFEVHFEVLFKSVHFASWLGPLASAHLFPSTLWPLDPCHVDLWVKQIFRTCVPFVRWVAVLMSTSMSADSSGRMEIDGNCNCIAKIRSGRRLGVLCTLITLRHQTVVTAWPGTGSIASIESRGFPSCSPAVPQLGSGFRNFHGWGPCRPLVSCLAAAETKMVQHLQDL